MKFEGVESPQIKQAIKRYTELMGEEKLLISPISPMDAIIIDLLHLAVNKVFPNFDLTGYKIYPDREVVDNLQKFVKSIPDKKSQNHQALPPTVIVGGSGSDEEERDVLAVFDDLNETTVLLSVIFAFEKKDSNKLLLNRTPEKTKGLPLFANTELTFTSKTKRDNAYKSLIEKML